MNHLAKYVGQRSFCWTVIVRTHTDAPNRLLFTTTVGKNGAKFIQKNEVFPLVPVKKKVQNNFVVMA